MDNASDYQKGRRAGIVIGIGLLIALDVFVFYRTRHMHVYQQLREQQIRNHGHGFGWFKEPVRREICQVEAEIKNALERNRRGFANAFDHGNWVTMAQDLGIKGEVKRLGVLGR